MKADAHGIEVDRALGVSTDEATQLQVLSHSKDKLLSTVGHDLRSVISSILIIVDMLDKRLKEGDLEAAKNLCELIRKTNRDADDLIKELIAWNRKTEQELKLHLKSIDIRQLIKVEVERFQTIADSKQLRIKIESCDPGQIRADPYMLQTILRNIFTNAIKFSTAGGEIKISIIHKPGLWEFMIEDEGIGMSEELQSRLLKVDERKKQVGTSGEVGLGLGLMLCEDFIQCHGGQLTWKSALGEGSIFSFTIPELIG